MDDTLTPKELWMKSLKPRMMSLEVALVVSGSKKRKPKALEGTGAGLVGISTLSAHSMKKRSCARGGGGGAAGGERGGGGEAGSGGLTGEREGCAAGEASPGWRLHASLIPRRIGPAVCRHEGRGSHVRGAPRARFLFDL